MRLNSYSKTKEIAATNEELSDMFEKVLQNKAHFFLKSVNDV